MSARLRVVIGLVLAAVALYFVIAQPENAAAAVRSVIAAIGSAFDSVTRFTRALFA